MLKKIFFLLPLILLSACASIERLAIPEKTLIQNNLAEQGLQDQIDHSKWDDFLSSYVIKDRQNVARVNYGGVTIEDKRNLDTYIEQLSGIEIEKFSKNAQLAYWTNLYNATTVRVILEHYPVSSIRDIKDGFLDIGPWENERLTIMNKRFSLHDIEHGVIRPLWVDTPEVHYIINCAAAGCPNISQQAYTASNINMLMQRAAKDYVNDSLRGVIIHPDGRLSLSKIYSWYLDDFGGSQASIIDHLKLYADPDLKNILENKTTIDHTFYDWSLNDTRNQNSLKKLELNPQPTYN